MLNKIKNEYKLLTINYKKGSDTNQLFGTFVYKGNKLNIVLDLNVKGYYGAFIKENLLQTEEDIFNLSPPTSYGTFVGTASNLMSLKSKVRKFLRNL